MSDPHTSISTNLRPGIEAIRKRPGMYAGDTDDGSGLHHMLWEVVSNALDLHAAGLCSMIEIELLADGGARVRDDGPGFMDRLVEGKPFIERALTELHEGPTMDGHLPHDHAGLHGVGLVVVHALSKRFQIRSNDGQTEVRLSGSRGILDAELDRKPADAGGARGVEVHWWPDPDVFDLRASWDAGLILNRLRELSALRSSLRLHFVDRREHNLFTPEGLAALSRVPVQFSAAGTEAGVDVQSVVGWSKNAGHSRIISYANLIPTENDGVHVTGALNGMCGALAAFMPGAARSSATMRKIMCSNLHLVLCVRLADASWAGPTKERLRTPAAGAACEKVLSVAMSDWLATEPAQLVEWREQYLRRNS